MVEEREGEERGPPDGRKRGRKRSLSGLKCAIKGLCINKQTYESERIIKKRGGIIGAPPRCVDADRTRQRRCALKQPSPVLLSGFYSSCSSNSRSASPTSKGHCQENFRPAFQLTFSPERKDKKHWGLLCGTRRKEERFVSSEESSSP